MSRSDIPQTLWRESKVLMPPYLSEALRAEMIARGLFEEACGPHVPDKELFGGKDDKETINHFTHRFKTSAARVQFVVLNPSGTFDPVATDLRACLLDGKVAILDVPCGSGGGLLGLLATLAELRVQACLPRLPLEVGILAGDCSQEARVIHDCMLRRVQQDFEAVGVRLRWQHADWDVTNPFSTSALLDRWFRFCPDCEEYVVFVSAFSGFGAKHTEPVVQAVRDMAVRFHEKTFFIAWIEPITNESKRLLPKLWEALARLFSWPTKGKGDDLTEVFEYVHPFTEEVIPGRARVLPFGKVSR